MTSRKCFFNFLLGLNASLQHLSRQHSIYKRSYSMFMWAFANIISLWRLWVEEKTQSIALSTPQEDICHFTFSQTPSFFSPPPLSGKTEFMSPCISLRQTEGYTQGLRRTYTARQSDCSFYATLFMLCSLMLDSEAFFFSCANYCSVSLLLFSFFPIFSVFSLF